MTISERQHKEHLAVMCITKSVASAVANATHPSPTRQAYHELQTAYDHFNKTLFDGRLPPCLVTLQRRSTRTYGYFAPHRFANSAGMTTDEIALNPIHFKHRPTTEVLSTLVHEMCHLWQQHFGRPSRSSYHNREWAGEMLRIGLRPSNTGQPGGRMTGQQMTHYVIADGKFDCAARDLLTSDFAITWFDQVAPNLPAAFDADALSVRSSSGKRIKFTCPDCRANAWGKGCLNVICGDCNQQLQPAWT